eukprot:TRINITY_DN5054_c0_g1_i10.p1 TRINITY_DN5054_c0_g1~~TRINITY_DN5054_c0_g1_i10.p1  ORF type:complete len:402 (+),score=95.05 TRINITY_DN5054_c0_g1_i10:72-1208(+)
MAAKQGTVKSFNPDKGFGFIDFNGNDIFFLKTDNREFARKGDTVSFVTKMSDRGAQATHVKVLNRESGGYLGVVKSFNPNKGFGFIECDQTTQMYNQDVFFMKTSVSGLFPEQGAKVTFQVTETEKGPHAVNVKAVSSTNNAKAPMQKLSAVLGQLQGTPGVNEVLGAIVSALSGQNIPTSKPGKGGMNSPRAAMGGKGGGAMQGGAATAMNGGGKGGAAEGKMSFGTVKSFNQQKGWGFLQTNSGEDIFVAGRAVQTGPLNVGDLVVFKKTQGPKGFQAEDVQAVQQHELQAAYQGVVKTFNAEKGWGFIGDTNGPKFGDVFLHRNDLGAMTVNVGDTLEFSVKMNNSGRPQAENIRVVGAPGAYGKSKGGQRYSPY